MKGNYAGKSHAHMDMKKESKKRGPCSNYFECSICMDTGYCRVLEGGTERQEPCPFCEVFASPIACQRCEDTGVIVVGKDRLGHVMRNCPDCSDELTL